MNIIILTLSFFVYSFCGWLWECLLSFCREHRFINRGFLNGPCCPIYGFGALAFLWLNQFTDNPIFMFFLGGTVACIIEYITSYVMEKLFNARWWDYSDWPFHINGRICLFGFLGFGLGAAIICYIQPFITNLLLKLPAIGIWANVAVAIFLIDIISTNQSVTRFNKILKEYQAILKKGRVAQFFERNGKKFIQTINNGRRRIFTWQQRRILRAFPNFKTHYDKAYNELSKLYKTSKFKPLKPDETRKKSEKRLK